MSRALFVEVTAAEEKLETPTQLPGCCCRRPPFLHLFWAVAAAAAAAANGIRPPCSSCCCFGLDQVYCLPYAIAIDYFWLGDALTWQRRQRSPNPLSPVSCAPPRPLAETNLWHRFDTHSNELENAKQMTPPSPQHHSSNWAAGSLWLRAVVQLAQFWTRGSALRAPLEDFGRFMQLRCKCFLASGASGASGCHAHTHTMQWPMYANRSCVLVSRAALVKASRLKVMGGR